MSSLSRFDVLSNTRGYYCAVLTIDGVCASVERVKDGLYTPAASVGDYGDVVGSGQGLRTPELAADAALLLVQSYLRAMMAAFSPISEFGARADCVVTL